MNWKRQQFLAAADAYQAKTGASISIEDVGDCIFIRLDGRAMSQHAFISHIGANIKEPEREQKAPRFTASEQVKSQKSWGANCGPVALAAITGLTLNQIKPYAKEGGISEADMRRVLAELGFEVEEIGTAWPRHGLAVIDWGSGKHWICCAEENGIRLILDNHAISAGKSWLPVEEWNRKAARPEWSGWRIAEAIEVWPGVSP